MDGDSIVILMSFTLLKNYKFFSGKSERRKSEEMYYSLTVWQTTFKIDTVRYIA